jgi:N utilization substance protein A
VVTELRGEKIDIVPFSDDLPDFVMKALSPAKVKEVRIIEETGTAEVIVPDFQLSLAIGKEGQNARLAARLTGWRVDIKSETQLAQEEAYGDVEWAEGEWVVDPETGEQVWKPADGGDAISAEDWTEAVDSDEPDADGDEAPLTESDAGDEAATQEGASEEE